jgi:hypothetical protein
MKKLLFILCLIPVFAFGQNWKTKPKDWTANQYKEANYWFRLKGTWMKKQAAAADRGDKKDYYYCEEKIKFCDSASRRHVENTQR